MKYVTIFLIFVVAFILVSSLSMAAGPWKGKIIDIETKDPLEGAVVLAVWERVYRTPAGPNSYFYEAKEVLTDKDGRFEIPSYTPINLLPIISYMRGPYFTFFKPGYLSLSSVDFGEFFLEGAKEEPLERKDISGKTFRLAPGIIELPKLKTREERIDQLPSGLMYEEAEKKAKNYMRLLNIERIDLGLDPIPERGGNK